VRSDFIASDYCYEREMTRAMERHENGDARVIPVILRPCDWHDLPFGRLLAAPQDGKPITKWSDTDEAFLDVERAIKAAVKEIAEKSKSVHESARIVANPSVTHRLVPTEGVVETPRVPCSSNLRVKKRVYRPRPRSIPARVLRVHRPILRKLNAGTGEKKSRAKPEVSEVDAAHFTAAVYRHGQKVCKCSVSISGGNFGSDSIEYAMDDSPRHSGMNEAVSVKADDQMLYFQALGMHSYGRREKEKLSPQEAAEVFWDLFVQPLQ